MRPRNLGVTRSTRSLLQVLCCVVIFRRTKSEYTIIISSWAASGRHQFGSGTQARFAASAKLLFHPRIEGHDRCSLPNQLCRSIRDSHSCSLTHLRLSPQPALLHNPTPIRHSKHIIPSGGFDQPTLSPVLRRPSLVHHLRASSPDTGDRVLVGYHPSSQLAFLRTPRKKPI